MSYISMGSSSAAGLRYFREGDSGEDQMSSLVPLPPGLPASWRPTSEGSPQGWPAVYASGPSSEPAAAPAAHPPRSRGRLIAARVLFAAVFGGAVSLLGYSLVQKHPDALSRLGASGILERLRQAGGGWSFQQTN
jgi:hypothetical protein